MTNTSGQLGGDQEISYHILCFAHHPYIQVNQVREDFNQRQQTMKKCQWIDVGIHIPIAEVIYNITHQTSLGIHEQKYALRVCDKKLTLNVV